MAGMFPSNNCLSYKDRLYNAQKRIYLMLAAPGALPAVVFTFSLAVALPDPLPVRPLRLRVPFGVQAVGAAGLN